jgi:hypothetical protein
MPKLLPMVLALVLAAAWQPAVAEERDPERGGRQRGSVSVPAGATSLVFDEGLRTILVNRGPGPIGLRVSVLDAEGTVVKQTPLVLEPGQTRSVEIGREEIADREEGVLLRTEIAFRRADAQHLLVASEVVERTTGKPKRQVVIRDIVVVIPVSTPSPSL